MPYIVAYDIADPRRLKRVARLLERSALRRQKSVFLFDGSASEVESLLDELATLIDVEQDVVQAWLLAARTPANGLVRGRATPALSACVVLASDGFRWVDDPEP
jgi:CRISPR-associated protein Cas2